LGITAEGTEEKISSESRKREEAARVEVTGRYQRPFSKQKTIGKGKRQT